MNLTPPPGTIYRRPSKIKMSRWKERKIQRLVGLGIVALGTACVGLVGLALFLSTLLTP